MAIPGVAGQSNEISNEAPISSNCDDEQSQSLIDATSNLKHRQIALRMQRAADLAQAIADADPEDARPLMTAALIDLHKGMPPSEALNTSAARDWAKQAGEAELVTIAEAVATELQGRALHSDQGRGLLRSLFLSMPLPNRLRFLKWGKENCACE